MDTKKPLDLHLDILENSTPKLRYDGSYPFEEWREKAYAKLSELLGMDRFVRCEPALFIEYEAEKIDCFEICFTFQSEPGYRPLCKLWLPKGIKNPPLAIQITGHNKGIHDLMGEAYYPGEDPEKIRYSTKRMVQALSEGYAALAIEQRGFGQRGGTPNGPDCLQTSVTALLLGRTIIGERAWDIMRLIDVMEENFADRIDLSSILLGGGSGGGTATFYTACLEKRIAIANATAAMCTYAESIAPLHHCMCNYIPGIAEWFDMGDLAGLIAPRVFVMDNGKDDPIFRVKGARETAAIIKKMYGYADAEDKFVYIEGDGGHQFFYDLVWPEIARLKKSL